MAAIVVRNLSPETHRRLQTRAAQHGRSTEAEVRLDEAVRQTARVKLGTALAEFGKRLGGLELEIRRDKTPAEPIALG
jgi:antitoxin FitA